jgi:hypothetical protein
MEQKWKSDMEPKWNQNDPQRERGRPSGQKGKGKSCSMRFEMHFHLAFHRAHARTTRNDFPVTGGPGGPA